MAGNIVGVDEERDELLNNGSKNDITTSSDSDNDMPHPCDCNLEKALGFVRDLLISVGFWYFLLFFDPSAIFGITEEKAALKFDEKFFNGLLIATGVSMVLWRLYRAFCVKRDTGGVDIPYTTAYFKSNDKEMYLVATLHISPKAPRDVEAVVEACDPDVVMIELDEERLDRMREPDEEELRALPKEPPKKDLQAIEITGVGKAAMTLHAQRAVWNAEWAGDDIAGDVVIGEDVESGACEGDLHGKVALVHRGTPFVLMAQNHYNRGAAAVMVVSNDDRLPLHRIGGGGTVWNDLKMVWRTKNCGYPPIPILLLPKQQGAELEEQVRSGGNVSADLTLLNDHYPRRSLSMRLCQACSLMCTGIGVLYGIIQCFAVEVGAEFTVAEVIAKARKIPCACIDVDLNRFWARLGGAVLPTPCNIFNSLWCWLCFPRILVQALFPPLENVDVAGSMVLHAASFTLRTWVAFVLAGFCASQITTQLLTLFGYGASKAVEATGEVSEENREDLQAFIMLGIQMYILPQVYTSIAASRDEAMYRMIVKKSRVLDKKRMVVVVGAAHSNGILQRARANGL